MQCRLFGKNISQSRSPYFHNQLAKQLNIDFSYELNSIDSGNVDDFKHQVSSLFKQEICAANITYPFKEIAIQVADKLDKSAERIGSANTLVKIDNEIVAFNTDYSGFIKAYKQSRSNKPGKVVLIGCGGVGKAIATALVDLETEELTLIDMDVKKANDLARHLSNDTTLVRTAPIEELELYAKRASGLVNCTPIGHYATPGNPFQSDWIANQGWVFDAVYTPIDTEFLLCAKGHNIETISGFELFFNQAADAFALFTGQRPSNEQLLHFRESHFAQLFSGKE